MVLPVVKYGHPVLRQPGARIERVTDEVRGLIRDMLETMREYHGVGLAAQQVGHALQLTVLDVRGVEDRPSTLEIAGTAVAIDSHMPLVLINPEFKPGEIKVLGPEGCLSFPEIYADVLRAESVDVSALDGDGRPLAFRCGGLLARAVQHEWDHLHGILFIDRMSRAAKDGIRAEIDQLQAKTKQSINEQSLKD